MHAVLMAVAHPVVLFLITCYCTHTHTRTHTLLQYTDPVSGYQAFTEAALRTRGTCCGNK
jgi:hypothetical protein